MAEPLAAAIHAISRGAQGASDVGVLGGGPMGLMLTSLLLARGAQVTVAEHHPDRRAQAQALGARAVTELDSHELVFEAVGRPETWRAAVEAAAPGGTVVLVGGCPLGTEASLPAARLHYDELDLRGTFHHAPAEVDEALAALSAGVVDWRALAGETIGLEQLPDALAAPPGRAVKWIVDPRL